MGLVFYRFNRLMPLFLGLLFCEYCRAQTAVPASEPSIAVSVKTEEHITECAGIHVLRFISRSSALGRRLTQRTCQSSEASETITLNLQVPLS
jgi:hypothetical protein